MNSDEEFFNPSCRDYVMQDMCGTDLMSARAGVGCGESAMGVGLEGESLGFETAQDASRPNSFTTASACISSALASAQSSR